MAEPRRNQLALLTESELRAALEIGGTPDSAQVVASRIFRVPVRDQPFYEWVDTTLMFASCVSDEIANRIREFFGSTEELRGQLAERQDEFRRWVNRPDFPGPVTPLSIEDVIFDVRTENPSAPR